MGWERSGVPQEEPLSKQSTVSIQITGTSSHQGLSVYSFSGKGTGRY